MVEWAQSLFDKATWTNPKSAASWAVRSFYSEYKYGCADVMDLIWSATSLLVLEVTATIPIWLYLLGVLLAMYMPIEPFKNIDAFKSWERNKISESFTQRLANDS